MLDGTGNQKDTSAEKQDSSEGAQGTSEKQEPKLLPETEVEARVQKLVSDRLAQAGRDAKALEMREAAIRKREEDWQKQQEEEQRRRDEAEEEAARNDPDKMSDFKKRVQLREKEAVIAKRERELEQSTLAHQAELESAAEIQREITIWDISQEYEGADPMKLKTLCETFKATSKEQIRQAADTLWAKKASGNSTAVKIPKGDSGKTIGGTSLNGLSPAELLKEVQKKVKS